jgi:hypothetical protein
LNTENKNDAVLDFDWTRCEPTSPLHPDTLVQSLDDTPERFQSAQTKNVQLRKEIQSYLLRASDRYSEASYDDLHSVSPDSSNAEQALAPPEWSIENISAQLKPEEMAYISVYDIGLKRRTAKYGVTGQAGHLFDRLVMYRKRENPQPGTPPRGRPPFIPFIHSTFTVTSRFVLPLRFACGRGKQVLRESKYNASTLIKIIV